MKRFTILLLLLISGSAFAQTDWAHPLKVQKQLGALHATPAPAHLSVRMGCSKDIPQFPILSDEAFEEACVAIDRQKSPVHKRNIALAAVEQNRLRTEDLLVLLKKMDSDADRLPVAKAAYANTINQESFIQLSQAFDSNKYARRMRKFMRSQQ